MNVPELKPTLSKGWTSRIGLLLPWKGRRAWSYGQSPIHSWKIEPLEPTNSSLSGGVTIQGWLLFHQQPSVAPSELVVKFDRYTELVYPLGIPRPDVISTVSSAAPIDHTQLRFGFRFSLPVNATNKWLYCRIAGRLHPLERLRPPSIPGLTNPGAKVLEGRDGWLFLSNDTNNSVDQHQGMLRFTKRGLGDWQKYAGQLARIGNQHEACAILLAAPTKESVLGQFHPLPSGGPSPVQQLESHLGDDLLLHPTNTLHALGTKAFSRTDTHWSDRAARAVALELAKRLKVPEATFSSLFQHDVYVHKKTCGDLGDKLERPRAESIDVLDPQFYSKFIVYDNGLRNTGRIMASENCEAAHQATLLLLGTSSSYAILKFACRIFSRVVLAHTAAGLDSKLISAVKPTFIVACTNARFTIQVPPLKYNLLRTIRAKLRQMSSEERQVALANRIAASADTLRRLGLAAYDPWVALM